MIFKANCYYCDSGDLKIIDITLGAGTEKELKEFSSVIVVTKNWI